MTNTRYFVIAALVSVALVSFCFLIATLISSASSPFAGSRFAIRLAGTYDHSRDYREQVEVMRVLHKRALTTTTSHTREAVARESGPVMHAGVVMMLRMKSVLVLSDGFEVNQDA